MFSVLWGAHKDDDFVVNCRLEMVQLIFDPREVTLYSVKVSRGYIL